MNEKLKILINEARNNMLASVNDLFNIIEIIVDDIEQLKSIKLVERK